MKSEESPISVKSEEYLEVIYRLEKKVGFARTVELARRLKVVPGSVTNTIENLERRGLVIHEPYKGIKLTETGRKLALNVLRRHRLAERLLTDVLHLDWSEAHDAACKLEHAFSNKVIKPLEKTLGHPKTCPHGNPIPTKCGGIFEEKSEPLSNLNPQEGGIVVKIMDEDSNLLRYLATLGLTPGTSVKIVEKAPLNDLITVEVDGTNHALSRKVASIVEVRKA